MRTTPFLRRRIWWEADQGLPPAASSIRALLKDFDELANEVAKLKAEAEAWTTASRWLWVTPEPELTLTEVRDELLAAINSLKPAPDTHPTLCEVNLEDRTY